MIIKFINIHILAISLALVSIQVEASGSASSSSTSKASVFIKQKPSAFVDLATIIPHIQQSVRYYGSENFLGYKVPGYTSEKIVCTRAAANALVAVQEELKKADYELVVYDGYRPQHAVDEFMRWSKDDSQTKKEYYYPYVDKKRVFELGYVAEKSGHSRGSTFDLSIIKLGTKAHNIVVSKRKLTDGREISFLDDGTVDMGSSFDLFDVASHHDTKMVGKEALDMRNFLREIMKKYGFKEYQEEWWHYTFAQGPFEGDRAVYFDFEIN